MMSTITERLVLLDTALLYHGSHRGVGGPDCKHCARELLHEIVTGKHRDATPPGSTCWAALLPELNDGPWRDDAHRTTVMRPYLRHFLPPELGGLDPARDEARICPVLDWCYREALPELLDTLQLPNEAACCRALPTIVVAESTKGALALAGARDYVRARALAGALDFALALALARALDLALAPVDAEKRALAWETIVRALLDRVCSIP